MTDAQKFEAEAKLMLERMKVELWEAQQRVRRWRAIVKGARDAVKAEAQIDRRRQIQAGEV